MRFLPKANDQLVLQLNVGPRTFRFVPHPDMRLSDARVPHSMSGEMSDTWRLEELTPGGSEYALKIMHGKFRSPSLPHICDYLLKFRSIPGLECCDRFCLTRDNCRTIEQYPDLEFSILMPWIKGISWFDAHQDHEGTSNLSRWETFQLARHLAAVLSKLEERKLAHCSLSAYNLIVRANSGNLGVALVGLEGLYTPDLPKTDLFRTRVAGYQHPSSEKAWNVVSDRFPGGLLISEILAWHDSAIRQGLYSAEYFFDPQELQVRSSDRYRLLSAAVEEHHKELSFLLMRLWQSTSESDCPSFSEWLNALERVARTKIAYTWLSPDDLSRQNIPKERCWDQSDPISLPWKNVKTNVIPFLRKSDPHGC